MAEATTSRPDYEHPDLVAVKEDLKLVSDLLAGTRRMWEEAKDYIRQWTDEKEAVWQVRARCEEVFEGLARTLSAAVGMLFAKAPSMEFPAGTLELEEHWKNIDAAGTAGHVFVKRFSDASVRDGVGLILVDHPSAPIDPTTGEAVVVTSATEVRLGLRPKWASYARSNIKSWRHSLVDNQTKPTQVVLWEPTDVDDGLYGVTTRDRYRVLHILAGLATWVLLEHDPTAKKDEDRFKQIRAGLFRNRNGEVYGELPISLAYTGRSDKPFTATIPLIGVAWANLGHWQISSNLRFLTELYAFPQPTLTGELAKEPGTGQKLSTPSLKLGPMVVVHLSEPGAAFTYTSPDTDAYEPLKDMVKHKEWQMSKLGMSFLAGDTRQAETAEAKRLDATAENATLSTAAQGVDDAINEGWRHHAWFMGLTRDQVPAFGINRDFESTAMDSQTMVAYVQAVDRAGLPIRLLLEAWKAGGRIPPDTDIDALELEMMAAMAAKEEEERQKREAALAIAQAGGPPGGAEEEEEEEEEE